MGNYTRIPTNFNVGDTVECVDDTCYSFLIRRGAQYEITQIKSHADGVQLLKLKYLGDTMVFGYRFKLIKAVETPTVQYYNGDKLICVRSLGTPFIQGNTYTFLNYDETGEELKVQESPEWFWYADRFIPKRDSISANNNTNNTKPMTPNQPRLANGRFAKPATIGGPQFIQAAPTSPLNLRKGSLYRIVGGGVGHFKGLVGDLAVLTVHKKPVVVEVSRVVKADKADVDAYLADAKANA